ncbi:F0F1 ATP synthase subunit A [Mycoplasmopsis verecunda]|uniref:F-type H+-transporting ATPase subunit a n=1 Tax=Mycoplasmopsis verecunda TaxID=171291 RepID=A0A1T4KKW1_9BACT|nr:F0F1 ATP synthase subunit A [Mycoplasmopsis verecunda]WPB54269.1 F0F1 ATP synthase subunit A [Mycoplasmopsis verecunda]SJZ43007.1 F-type H+-transporting ATPase subunit a [Mycoplasmopsis verecunda]
MKKFDFMAWNQPQLLSLLVTVLVILIISIVVYIKVSKVKENEAPKGIAQIAEAYVGMIDNTFEDTTGGDKVQKSRLYIFTLATFILIGNLTAVFGLEPIVTSYSVPFTLAIASWLGIFIVGAIYQRTKYLKSFLNPLDLPGKVSPLVSLSFRIYGNVIGGTTVIFLVYSLFGYFWTKIPGIGANNHEWYFLAMVISPVLHFYFDIFGSTLQAYIFTLLTTVYWVVEASTPEKSTDLSNKTDKKKLIQKAEEWTSAQAIY